MERKDNSPFQRDVVYNKLLPYSECLDHEALVALEEIKYNLGRSVVLKELRPGALHWSNRLFRFVASILVCSYCCFVIYIIRL
jgi:hypothetical protein